MSQTTCELFEAGSVTSAALSDGAVTAAKLAAGAGGKILQVVQNTSTGTFSSTDTTLVTIVTRTITPVAASSKILIIGQCGQTDGTAVDSFAKFAIVRGSTEIWAPATSLHNTNDSSFKQATEMSLLYLDAPTYTVGNELTYHLKFCNNVSAGTMYVRNGSSSIICLEVAA